MTRSLLAVTLAISTSGCSYGFMSRAPRPVLAPDYPVDCSSTRAAPVLDSICAGYFAASAVLFAAATSCSAASGEFCFDSGVRTGGILAYAGVAGLCALSARTGFREASHCREVKSLNALCITGHESACTALTPGWTPRGSDRWGSSPRGPARRPAAASDGDDSGWSTAPATP
jgi:hypothetical protein